MDGHPLHPPQRIEVFLETDRLILRRFTDADVDNLVGLDADPDVMFFISGGIPTARDEIETSVLPRFLWYHATFPGWGFWAVIEKMSDDFIGWFHLRPDPEDGIPDEPELGYRLRRSAWGNGYATEGARALVDKAFADLGASRVFATTMAVNRASRRVMEKAGLRFERAFHADWPVQIPGDEHGDVEYAITREEWEWGRCPQGALGET